MNNTERNISLIGKSGNEYYGKIYEDKTGETSLSGKAIVCLGHSRWHDNHWEHRIRDIYKDDVTTALNHFKERDDISHIILISEDADTTQTDIVDDLRRQYVHK